LEKFKTLLVITYHSFYLAKFISINKEYLRRYITSLFVSLWFTDLPVILCTPFFMTWSPHYYITHDIIIIQTTGRCKDWRICHC